jgi:transcriptional regulator with XRE-family HTH domain
VRRRRLAAALKRLRDQSGMTADEAAKQVGISKSALSRIENAQVSVMTFQPQLIPGLLQTADYARAVIRVEHPDAPDEEVNRRVELRMKRQETSNPPRLWVVLDEATLRRPVGGSDVMRGQLRRLIEAGTVPGNAIQILPFAAGEHGSMGSAFSILSFPEPTDPGVVYVETRAGSLYLEGQQVREYTAVFQHLVATALGHKESMTMIAEAVSQS